MVKHLFALLLLALFIFTACEGAPKHPVVLVPGLGASKLWNIKDSEPNCYSGLWIDPYKTILNTSSLIDDLKLDVNPTTGAATDEPHNKVNVCGFGDPTLLTNLITPFDPPTGCGGDKRICTDNGWLDDFFVYALKYPAPAVAAFAILCAEFHCSPQLIAAIEKLLETLGDLQYYQDMINSLKDKGYNVNKDIKGAPYDFRKAPDDQTEFYSNLTQLVEDLYHDNNNVPVVIIAHSMGNPVLLNFYNKHTTKEWKDKYIHAHVALAPPWAGSVKPVKVMVSGENEHIPIVDRIEVRRMQRSWPGMAWLMPSPANGLWKPEEPLVVTPSRNYSVKDYEQLFDDLDYHIGYLMWERTQLVIPDLSKLPELRGLHVLYGANVDTPIQYFYPAGSFPDSDPQVKNGTGDGTVNQRSLEAFKEFEPNKSINLTHHAFNGVDHMEIMKDHRVLKFITDLVLNYEDTSADDPSQEREKTEL